MRTSRALLTSLAATLLISTAAAQTPNNYYSDVPAHHWAATAVNTLSEEGILVGNPDGTFSGTTLLSRYELATILHRFHTHHNEHDNSPSHDLRMEVDALTAQVELLTQQNQDLFNLIQQLMANQNIETSAINTRIKRLESITDILQTISTTPAPDYSQEQPEPETTTVNTTATPAQPANPVATNEPEPEPQVMQTEAAEQTLTQLAVNSTTQLLNMIASTTNE